MRILVTGASGFIGRELCIQLASAGLDVVALSRKPIDLPAKVTTIVVNSLLAYDSLPTLFKGVDCVVHAAGLAHVSSSGESREFGLYYRVNVELTKRIMLSAAKSGVSRFIYISSARVFSDVESNGLPFKETDPPTPVGPYAESKFQAESAVRKISAESMMEHVIIRTPLVYGPKSPGNFGLLATAIASRLPLPLGAYRYNKRSFVSLINLIDFIRLVIKHPRAVNETFHVSDGIDLSTVDLCRKMAHSMGKRVQFLHVPDRIVRPFFSLLGKNSVHQRLAYSLQLDTHKAACLLEWKPLVSQEVALEEYLRS
jgi:nucleoside-diphosphate-sugar epimerase